MEEKQVIKALAALAQPHRLQIFRALVVTGAQGLTPAVMAEVERVLEPYGGLVAIDRTVKEAGFEESSL